MLRSDHGISVGSVRVILGYQVRAPISESEAETLVYELFADPIIEAGSNGTTLLNSFPSAPRPQSRSAIGQG